MSLIVADNVFETSTTTGTGALTLAAAVTGYQRFSAVMSISDTCYYSVWAVDANGNRSGDWEVGLGTYSGTNTLTRTTPQASTNSGAAVNFAAGTKHVILSATGAYLATSYKVGGTDVALTDGGTGSSTASGARTNLGLVIGTNVQAWDTDLDALAGLSGVQGDVIYRSASQWQRLPAGASGQVLQANGASADPTWVTPSSGAITGSSFKAYSAGAAVGTPANTTETDLQSYALAAGLLTTNGQSVRIRASGTFAATTRSRTARLYFGATQVGNSGPTVNASVTAWLIDVIIHRTGAATQLAEGFTSNNFINATTVTSGVVRATPAETLANSITVKATGQSGGSAVANDVICDQFVVEVLP